MNLDFFLAKQKHKLWLIKVKAYLLDIQDLNLSELFSHKECELGKWLYEFGFEAYKSHEEMIELEKIHKNLHDTVKLIVELKMNNNIEEAFLKFEILKKISFDIVLLLDKLQDKELPLID